MRTQEKSKKKYIKASNVKKMLIQKNLLYIHLFLPLFFYSNKKQLVKTRQLNRTQAHCYNNEELFLTGFDYLTFYLTFKTFFIKNSMVYFMKNFLINNFQNAFGIKFCLNKFIVTDNSIHYLDKITVKNIICLNYLHGLLIIREIMHSNEY